jgi:hypothetical protein
VTVPILDLSSPTYHEWGPPGPHHGLIIWMDKVKDGAPEQIRGIVAEHGSMGGTDVDEAELQIQGSNQIVGVLGDQVIECFGPLPLGHLGP